MRFFASYAPKFLIILLSFCGVAFSAPTKTIRINHTVIEAEVVDTQPERTQGLMFRENLCENCGMLFIFEEDDYHGIWMKNMRFNLDIIWIDQNKKIIDIFKNAPPCSLDVCNSMLPKYKAKYVLEFGAGFLDKHNINIGDEVKF